MGDTKDPTNCNFHREHFKNSTGVSGYSLGFSGTKPKSCCFSFPIFITVYIYDDIYIILVGGFKHLLFSILYGMSSFPLTLIFFKMVKTTNQYIYNYDYIYISITSLLYQLLLNCWCSPTAQHFGLQWFIFVWQAECSSGSKSWSLWRGKLREQRVHLAALKKAEMTWYIMILWMVAKSCTTTLVETL